MRGQDRIQEAYLTLSLNLTPNIDALDAAGTSLFPNETEMTGLIMSIQGSRACVVSEEGTFAFEAELSCSMPVGWRVRFTRTGDQFQLL